jgi:hypothetical protein
LPESFAESPNILSSLQTRGPPATAFLWQPFRQAPQCTGHGQVRSTTRLAPPAPAQATPSGAWRRRRRLWRPGIARDAWRRGRWRGRTDARECASTAWRCFRAWQALVPPCARGCSFRRGDVARVGAGPGPKLHAFTFTSTVFSKDVARDVFATCAIACVRVEVEFGYGKKPHDPRAPSTRPQKQFRDVKALLRVHDFFSDESTMSLEERGRGQSKGEFPHVPPLESNFHRHC